MTRKRSRRDRSEIVRRARSGKNHRGEGCENKKGRGRTLSLKPLCGGGSTLDAAVGDAFFRRLSHPLASPAFGAEVRRMAGKNVWTPDGYARRDARASASSA